MKFTCPKCDAINEKTAADPLGCACCGYNGPQQAVVAVPVDDGLKESVEKLQETFKKMIEAAEKSEIRIPNIKTFPEIVPFRIDDPRLPRCAFDGLPPGAYLLSCSCPRCTPWC
jgi:hypothetical protein